MKGKSGMDAARSAFPSFGEISVSWLGDLALHVKESTCRFYSYIWAHYLAPVLSGMAPEDVTKDTAREIIGQYGSVSPVTARNLLAVLKSLLRYTETVYALSLPKQALRLPSGPQAGGTIPDGDWKRLQDAVAGEESEVATSIALASWMGLRTGEICALRRKDIDLAHGLLYVRHTVQRIGGGGGKTELYIGSPKSDISNRVIPIPDRLLPKLRGLCKGHGDGDYLFGRDGKATEPRVLQYRFRRYLAQHGLPNINFRQLRRKFAVQGLERNADIRALGEILGDSSVGLAARCCAGATLDEKREEMNRLAAAL